MDLARQRVRSGQVSERALARLCGTSQPHIHNVLKNIRSLSPASADRLLDSLDITIPEILWGKTPELEEGIEAVPIVRHRIGPGILADLAVWKGAFPLEKSVLKGLIHPVLARLSPDPLMPGELRYNDLVLLDQNARIRQKPDAESHWIVAERGGMRVRYLRFREQEFWLANAATRDAPENWQPLRSHGRNILDVVRARIVWISRKMEAQPDGPADGTGESN